MKKIQMKVVSLLLGAGILLSAIPAASVQAAPVNAIDETKKQIMAMTESIHNQEEKITEISDDITAVGEKIRQNEADIEGLTQQIQTTRTEVEVTREQLGDKEELYGRRLREVYKNGHTSTISTLLGASNLSDLLLRFKAVENIAKHDKQLIDSINELKEELEDKARTLEANKTELEDTTEELRVNEEALNTTKASQEDELTTLLTEKNKLRELLVSQEVELFAEIERILGSNDSTEQEVKDALAILETIQSQVSTAEAVAMGRKLESEGRELAKELKAARMEAERLAREKEEAEQRARELKAKKDAEAAKKAAEEAAQKEKERKAALAKARELEQKQSEQAAQAKKLAAEEKAAKDAAAKAEVISDKQTKPSSGNNNLTFYLSFYTDLPEHNGGWTVTATGDKLTYGVVANNVWPLYTKIYLEGYGTMTVKDRGGAHFYNRYRLDVFIPRKSGETNKQYTARVWSLGRKTTKGRILK